MYMINVSYAHYQTQYAINRSMLHCKNLKNDKRYPCDHNKWGSELNKKHFMIQQKFLVCSYWTLWFVSLLTHIYM